MRSFCKKASLIGLIFLVSILGTGCAGHASALAPVLLWKIEVSQQEIKESLSGIETVTQYNGATTQVAHQQSPDAGNVYLILKVSLSKTGAESAAFEWESLVLKDATGQSYHRHANDTFLEQYGYRPRLTGLEIRFGASEGWLCFEIPAAAAKGTLTLAYSGEGSQQEIVIQK